MSNQQQVEVQKTIISYLEIAENEKNEHCIQHLANEIITFMKRNKKLSDFMEEVFKIFMLVQSDNLSKTFHTQLTSGMLISDI
jgi:hypothetical protein